MKSSGRVVRREGDLVWVAVEGNEAASVAACCTVPTVILETHNPGAVDCQPGDMVEVSDGLGMMALGAAGFLVLPGLSWATASSLAGPWWAGLLALPVGFVFAALFFRSLKVGQYPRVVGRVGPSVKEVRETEVTEKEYL